MAQMLLLLLSMLLLFSASVSAEIGVQARLAHVDSKLKLTKIERLLRTGRRSRQRLASYVAKRMNSQSKAAATTGIETPVEAGQGDYLMDLAIGTPAISFSAVADTGSDLLWLQCMPCKQCFPQSTPIYDPSGSSTFNKLPCTSSLCSALPNSSCTTDCEYYYSYADNSSTQGYLATETFTFGSTDQVLFSGLGFGCGNINKGNAAGGAGIAGLGLGSLSLVSQLGVTRFSYCLTPIDDTNTSPLFLGSLATISGHGTTIQSTPLFQNSYSPTFYYISLIGITVGTTKLLILSDTFALQADGSGGCIIDSGTTYTYLTDPAYQMLQQEFVNQVNLPLADGSDYSLDTCFSTTGVSPSSVTVPSLVFHLEGADLTPVVEDYILIISSKDMFCLMVNSNGDNTSASVFGNAQQRNMQILYDLQAATLSFAPAQCEKL